MPVPIARKVTARARSNKGKANRGLPRNPAARRVASKQHRPPKKPNIVEAKRRAREREERRLAAKKARGETGLARTVAESVMVREKLARNRRKARDRRKSKKKEISFWNS
jgi:hypothetical protein